jgi:hypothetical protein
MAVTATAIGERNAISVWRFAKEDAETALLKRTVWSVEIGSSLWAGSAPGPDDENSNKAKVPSHLTAQRR